MGSFLPHKITQQNIMKQTIKRVKSMETKVPGIMLMHTKSTKKLLVPPKPKVSNHPPINQCDISSSCLEKKTSNPPSGAICQPVKVWPQGTSYWFATK